MRWTPWSGPSLPAACSGLWECVMPASWDRARRPSMDSWLLPRSYGGPETAAPSTPACRNNMSQNGTKHSKWLKLMMRREYLVAVCIMQQTFWISSRISSLLSSMQDWKMCRSISCRMGLIHISHFWRTKTQTTDESYTEIFPHVAGCSQK